jgi:hypothetical protein
MVDTVVVLHAPTDRRVFDLFNWLRIELPNYAYLVWSRHQTWLERILYPGAQLLKTSSLSGLLEYIAAHPKTKFVWLPVVEDELAELLQHPSLPPNLCALFPDKEALEIARNKTRLSEQFMDRGWTPQLYTLERLKKNFPSSGVVAKPAIGKGAIGRQYINSAAELHKIQPGDTIQQRIGEGKEVIGALFLMQNGKVVRHYQHKRVRTYPADGGVSSCAKTVYIPEVAETGAKILSSLGWNGLAMLEFLQDTGSGKYLAIECNPRLWGTSLLGEFAGHCLVEDYIRLALGMELPIRNALPEAFIRWYFPYEMLYALRKPVQRMNLLLGVQLNTCYIGGTRAGWFRAILFIAASLLKFEKWQILFKKITGRR